MTQTEWSMWANEQAVVSAFVLLTGSIVGIAGMFHNWPFGIYGLIASLIMLVFEWPRGKRIKGRTVERRFQRPFSILVDKFGIFGRNYFVRFVVYLILCVPCCFILATLLGGVCLLMTSLIYFLAAIRGEEWRPTYLDQTDEPNKKRVKSLHPPKKPPPRLGAQGTGSGDQGSTVDVEAIGMDITDMGTSHSQTREPTSPADKKPTRPPPRPRTAAREGIQTVS